MLLLLHICVFVLNHKLPSITILHKASERFTTLYFLSRSSFINIQRRSSCSLSSRALSPATASWIICPWFISCSSARSRFRVFFFFFLNIAKVGGVIGICFRATSGHESGLYFSLCLSCLWKLHVCWVGKTGTRKQGKRAISLPNLYWIQNTTFFPSLNLLFCTKLHLCIL